MLRAMTEADIREWLETRIPGLILNSEVAILVDCVFGWAEGSAPLWKLFQRAHEFESGSGPRFGRSIAEGFFAKLLMHLRRDLPSQEPAGVALPHRRCEVLSGANSVFQSRPFQRNIQTGTFRIWREMGESGSAWANLWPFDAPQDSRPDRPWVFEAYPTWLWREVLGLRVREPLKLRSAVTERLGSDPGDSATWERIEGSPDLADAAVLAIGGFILDLENRLEEPFPSFREQREISSEGWIVGVSSGGARVQGPTK